jgi:hypothetical protein
MPTNWIHLAVASGLCAATNGLFAKLTTTTLTTSLAAALAAALSLPKDSRVVELAVRGVCSSPPPSTIGKKHVVADLKALAAHGPDSSSSL